MEFERDWQPPRRDSGWDLKNAGMGLLRFTLLFGLCAMALAVIAVPALQKRLEMRGIDPMSVASTRVDRAYIVPADSMNASPNSICVGLPNDTRSRDC